MPEASLREYQALVAKYAAQFGVPYHLALAILETESNYRPRAESPKGAKGLFQIMPVISARYGVTDPFDPEQNIRAGVEHLGVLLRKYGDETLAAAAYNAGEPKVDDARGVPAIPETQQYVQKVAAAQTRLGTEPETGAPRAQEAPMAQESQFYERWIYPTRRHGGGTGGIGSETDEFRDGDGVPIDEKDPEREGILVSWEGSPNDGPKPNEIRQIFQEVDPGGVITAQDASDLAALGTSTGVGSARFLARRLRGILGTAARRTVTAGRFVPGVGWTLPLLVGLSASLGQAYSASQVPKEVGRFAIESWPRSRYGMHYEGAPDTPLEHAHSMAVAGGQELLGEGIGGGLATLPRKFGKWWKSTAFEKDMLRGIDRTTPGGDVRTFLGGQQGAAKTLAETGTSPTVASKLRAQKAGDLAEAAGGGILGEAESALGPLRVNTQKVVEDTFGYLEGSVDHLTIQQALGRHALSDEAAKTLGGVLEGMTEPAVMEKVPRLARLTPEAAAAARRDTGVMLNVPHSPGGRRLRPSVSGPPGSSPFSKWLNVPYAPTGTGPGIVSPDALGMSTIVDATERIQVPAVLKNIPLGKANQMRKEAGALATPLWNQARRPGQAIAPNEAKVQGALSRALRENIHATLNNAERSARGGRLQRGVKRIKNLGRPGSTRRFGDRWRNQVDYARQWYTARNLAEVAADKPISGLAAGAAAFSLPGLALSLGRPDIAGVSALATLPQLFPISRSLTGGGLYKAGGALGMAPVQAARALHLAGGPDPPPYQRTPLVNFESFGLGPAVERLRNWRTAPGPPPVTGAPGLTGASGQFAPPPSSSFVGPQRPDVLNLILRSLR